MAETPTARRWLGRLTFLGLALLIVFAQLLPLNTIPRLWASPDLLLALTLVWVARRPDLLPVPLIALVFLVTDLLFQRPPGLWTALVLILTEIVRARAATLRNVPFPLEWMTVAAGILAVTLANRAVLAIVLTPQAPLGLTLIQTLMTVLVYPLVVGLSHVLFGVSRPAPGEVDALGHRL
jgi:rod shape-determining protein MreD